MSGTGFSELKRTPQRMGGIDVSMATAPNLIDERAAVVSMPSRRMLARGMAASATVLILLIIDALARERESFDYRMIDEIQRIDVAGLDALMRIASTVTSAFWAAAIWTALLFFLAVVRRAWLPALTVVLVPVGGAVSWLIRHLIDRPKPDFSRLYRPGIDTDITAFPSGHVVGAVMLWGLVFYLAGRIGKPAVRYLVRAFSLAILVLSGPSRVWLGAHWVSDVVAAYALGAMLLLALIWVSSRIETAVGDIPFIRAAEIPHDESQLHAHALTSTIIFEPERVIKIYAPGFVPRALYWLSFQAEFPYLRNIGALRAAVLRRNLAGLLTEYWYGENRVARALGIEQVGERFGLASERINAVVEPNAQAAHDFLMDLADRFDAAGLPTWQIDPRQPRGKDNVLQTADGRFYIVDLESGLVSLLASPRAWLRGFRRADVPLFDSVDFAVTRAYVEAQASEIRASMGEAWYRSLQELLAEAEEANVAWHASEPRIWSRALGWLLSGFGIPHAFGRLRRSTSSGRDRAELWLNTTVDVWENEGRITADRAAAVRESIAAPQVHRVLPHFGVHLVIGIATRFPVGSILRASYSLINLLGSILAFMLRKIGREELRRRMAIHSPLVILVAGMPGVGTFAYLLSGPIRSNHLLLRMMLDTVLLKFPGDIYERFGWRAIVAYRPQHDAGTSMRQQDRVTPFTTTTLRAATALGLVGVALILVDVVTQTLASLLQLSGGRWDRAQELFDADSHGSLTTWYAIVLLLICAGVSLISAAALWRRREGGVVAWGAIGIAALLLSVEEHYPGRISIVAIADELIDAGLDLSSGTTASLVLAGVAIAAFAGYRFLLALPLELRGVVLLGVTLFMGGAVGLEFAGRLYLWLFEARNLIYQSITSAEELAELLGIVVLLYAVLEQARRTVGEIQLRLIKSQR